MNDIYGEYALIESKIEELELQKAALKPKILEDLVSKDITSEKRAYGTFTVATVQKWTYPEHVEAEAKLLEEAAKEVADKAKAIREKAKSTNEATAEESKQLRFTVAKL